MNDVKMVYHTIKNESPVVFWILVSHALMFVLCLIGLAVDDRVLLGVNVWIKPLKFVISSAIYIATVAFLLPLYPYSKKKQKIINGIVAWTMLVDVIIIVLQGYRGVQSHYNVSTAFDGILFMIMGVFVGINVIFMALFIIDSIRLKLKTTKSIQWAIVLGWLVVFFGSWIGGQMISQFAHNVGVADGGAGIPVLNWSTIAGDLRVAHFFGLHGIQIIPIFAYLLFKKWQATDKQQIALVTIFGLIYAGLIGFTFYQAKQGLPFIGL